MMIIVVCTDDPELVEIAAESVLNEPEVFLSYYKIFHSAIPPLGFEEDLFIIAHGAFQGDEGRPVIGDRDGDRDFYLNGEQCFINIRSLIPPGYKGKVYVDACQSATDSQKIDSFITTLQVQFLLNSLNTHVYGINGDSSGLIPLPDDPKWRPAKILR
ncbi:hypothetical protein R2970_001108 [Enterobacter cloacae]|uniref:hypothetical protein n=1 Tax=Enterobacter cloacae TaxID=550 RepID=UPI0020052069|nr:hypothetical protein [Enterobacter cloacae]MCK7165830.1 hypothetical protein [Enterobacter cloacae]